MSKVEDLALEKYPPRSVLVVPARGGGYYADNHLREGFIEGYHQAEKDNKLTWEDLKALDYLLDDVYAEYDVKMFDKKEYYQEVLKRFKDFKERKQQ